MNAVQWASFFAGGVILILILILLFPFLDLVFKRLDAKKVLRQLRRDLAAGKKYRCKATGEIKDAGGSETCKWRGITCDVCADPSNTSVYPEVP